MQSQTLESDMVENLELARELASKLRFAADVHWASDDKSINDISGAREQLYQDAIEISPLITPNLWERFCNVCERLHVPRSAVCLFIYSSKDIQGECYARGGSNCVIRFSSGLIDLLDEEEFEFVIGHELGHFLLDHHAINAGIGHPNSEYFRHRRSQEISVDRIGLVSCASLDIALRALMKTVSGLTERHLRFDVGAFISQLRKIEFSTPDWSGSTHPSILIRAKALLWFSLSDYFLKGSSFFSLDQMRKIDSRVERDLHKFVDGAVNAKISELKQDLLLWMVTLEIARSGFFSTATQDQMRFRFGEETIQKLRSFLAGLPKDEAEAVIYDKLKSARNELEPYGRYFGLIKGR
jgi:hypothetical protein